MLSSSPSASGFATPSFKKSAQIDPDDLRFANGLPSGANDEMIMELFECYLMNCGRLE